MIDTALISLTVLLQCYVIIILHRITRKPLPAGEPEKKGLARFITPHGVFAVESDKRKTTINDDETLWRKEQERR